MNRNRFVFVMPAYNAAETIQYSINTVMMQNYPDWGIVVVDDMSTDGTPDAVQEMIDSYNMPEDRLKLIVNTEKKWEIANVLEGMKYIIQVMRVRSTNMERRKVFPPNTNTSLNKRC